MPTGMGVANLKFSKGGRKLMSLKVIHFQSIFLVDFLSKKANLGAKIWNN